MSGCRELDAERAQRGAALFEQSRCAACHVPDLVTGLVPGLPAPSGQKIRPYTALVRVTVERDIREMLKALDARRHKLGERNH